MDLDVQEETRLNWAAWTSLTEGIVSFTRDWVGPRLPELWWGEDRQRLESLKQMEPEYFGLRGGYFGNGTKLSFVLPCSQTKGVKTAGGIYLAGSFNGWQEAIGDPQWRLQRKMVHGKRCHVLTLPRSALADVHLGTFKFVTGDHHWIELPEDIPNTHVDGFGIKNYLFSADRTGRHLFTFSTPLPLNQSEGRKLYFQHDGHVDSLRLSPGVFLKTLDTEQRLGAIVRKEETEFRVFAPRAASVRLYLYKDADGDCGEPIPLQFADDLCWSVVVKGNRHGWFYHYTISGQEAEEVGYFDPDFRVLDPYARAVAGPLGPAIVVEDRIFKRSGKPFEPTPWHDLVIAETHVRDLNAHAPVEMTETERAGFTGLRKWVRDEAFYLEQLGVNAVELMPVHEFDTVDPGQYGWGYMPVNYFSPASQYTSDPCSLKQVEEFRALVESFHERGLSVILDVVYNHVGEPNYLQYLDREYYFLLTREGHHENHSGCGNTLDANAPMVRRLIRDSLLHWIEAYDVDGFRFDLGELLGKETLAWLEDELKEAKPGIILIAEPWSFRGHIGKDLRETGFASWNDGYREQVRAYLTGHAEAEGLEYFMKGSQPDWSRFPAQTVNYVASHDDRCWIDKITENGGHDGHRPTHNDRRRTHMMAGILMMSLGIPMVAAGDDFLKSKGGESNTYLRGDLNYLPYLRAAEYSGSAAYFRAWIAFRRSSLGRYLRLDRFAAGDYFMTSRAGSLFGMIYNARLQVGPERLLFVLNPTFEFGEIVFADLPLEGFVQLADTERWGDPVLAAPLYPVKGNAVTMPPLSCGLFLERVSG